MRLIKFRAWDRQNKAWIYWDHLEGSKSWFWDMVDKYDCELMQFTGLLDKNGKEIWEFDLFKNESERICKVVWFQPIGGWDAYPINHVGNPVGFDPADWKEFTEVIGNIYENPELLKDGR